MSVRSVRNRTKPYEGAEAEAYETVRCVYRHRTFGRLPDVRTVDTTLTGPFGRGRRTTAGVTRRSRQFSGCLDFSSRTPPHQCAGERKPCRICREWRMEHENVPCMRGTRASSPRHEQFETGKNLPGTRRPVEGSSSDRAANCGTLTRDSRECTALKSALSVQAFPLQRAPRPTPPPAVTHDRQVRSADIHA